MQYVNCTISRSLFNIPPPGSFTPETSSAFPYCGHHCLLVSKAKESSSCLCYTVLKHQLLTASSIILSHSGDKVLQWPSLWSSASSLSLGLWTMKQHSSDSAIMETSLSSWKCHTECNQTWAFWHIWPTGRSDLPNCSIVRCQPSPTSIGDLRVPWDEMSIWKRQSVSFTDVKVTWWHSLVSCCHLISVNTPMMRNCHQNC